MTRKSGWIGVDFDGTLAYYEGFMGPYTLGEPIPKMVERVKNWLEEGREVRIFTARVSVSQEEDADGRDVEKVRETIENWCLKHIGQKLQVTNIKDHKLYELWDDRAVQVIKNTGERVG